MRRLVDSPDLLVLGTPVGPFAMNQMAIVCRRSGTAALIDPGGPPGPFLAALADAGATPARILLTHAHIDHVLGLADTRRAVDVPIALHPDDGPLYAGVPMQAQLFGVPCPPLPPVDEPLAEGDTVAVGHLRLDVLHTPGHAPGHVVFHLADNGVLIGGDLLFRGSIGRIDLPGADPDAMRTSLDRLRALPGETVVLPGHMEPTTIGEELRTNPFLLYPDRI